MEKSFSSTCRLKTSSSTTPGAVEGTAKANFAYVSQLRSVSLCDNSPNPNSTRRAWNVTLESISISRLDRFTRHNRAHYEIPACKMVRRLRVRLRSTRQQLGIGRTPRRHPTMQNVGLPQSSTCTRQHALGSQANSPPAFRHRGTMGHPQSSTWTRHSAQPGASRLPASAQAQLNNRTPRAAHAAHTQLLTRTSLSHLSTQQACTSQPGITRNSCL